MIWDWIIYVIIFLACAIGVALVYFLIVAFGILKPLTGSPKLDDTRPEWVNSIIIIFLFIIPISSPFFILKSLDYGPPLNSNIVNVEEKNSDDKILQLSKKITVINNTLSNLDNLTINEIRNELSKVLLFVEELREETINQKQAIISLKSIVEDEKAKADNAIQYAEKVSSLTNEQIEAVSVLILSDANKQNEKSFWIGVLISFPIGVIASLLASILWKRVERKTDYNNA